ncbi:proto-oncogene tyrosine-protein kinase ROS isoform X2 [Pectinophora gossypiella]|uniref:proto-oncogene tyrosine-protein kinase ROS isoform X2 n=1 Tax=Pectinophora gossypiella TaxID=13191 RepID=UPI00214E4B0B|nr:proto-oncogene tyrosine-protein kinase ROS isoform X2 [Pectinophora gossypiella]
MSAPLNWHKWLVLSLLGLALSARPIGCDYSSITEKFGAEAVARCNEKCPFQNRTDGHFDVSCASDCSVQQCTLGCSLWQEGLEFSCQTVCNVTLETVVSRELYCVMGCNEALNTYFQKLRELIGIPPAPALVADSLTATSLSLVWEPRILGNLSYLVQWRYEELPGSWQYYSNASHSDRSIIHVENLRPYTKYRFRVAIFLSGHSGIGEPVYSAPSVVISTLESGKPSSAPSALRAAAPDPSRVAISWEPGAFPNGPLISYVLRLTDTQPNTIDALEDMPASNNTLFYMFQNLAPAREYEVSVSMRNSVGEGPRAYVRVSTPPLPTVVPSEQPILILGGEQNIVAAPANDMLSDPVELYSTEHKITGVGLDVSSDSLFVSVSNGYVYRSSLSKKNIPEAILTPQNISYKPLDLSVDWLNRHLYVLGEVYYTRDANSSNATLYSIWEILRYDFDGRNQVVALSGYFNSRPIHFEVDAYNGYLFWALRGVERGGGSGGGLYRLDLANISNGVRHDAPPELIVRDAHLGAFTVDHADFRLLVAHLKKNTVLAVSLDGREVADFRSNTQKPMFLSTRSIAYASGLFYWTNGKEMLTEEYHAQSDSYFHNEYPLAYNTKTLQTRQVLVALRSCQPIPVPVNPPIGVQSVMGIERAKVSWSPPHLLGHQGSGAWQQWTFHLQLTHADSGETIDIKNINESTFIVEDLKQDVEYVIRVAAVTKSGAGPWSSEFVGKTLAASPTTLNSTLVWSGPDGLLETDLTGEKLRTLIDRTSLKDFHITDISWYRDKLYLVTNASTVMWFNTTSHESGLMSNMENVGSLAVDWVGKKIYWSNPTQQLITRGNFDGSNREPVPIVTVAKELTIDSLGAYIYWNTGHAVEAARLNGENKMVYYPAQLFSGKQVMGLTADLERKWLYWLVRSYDGSELHRAPTADQITNGIYEISGSLVTRLAGTATLGPLCYFSGRLVWVEDASRAVVSDLYGRYTADLVPRVHVVAVRIPALHADSESLIAIPETINSSSITVVGESHNFNVTWSPATNVNINNSSVYYDVSLHFAGHYKIEKTVDVPWVEVRERSLGPYTAMDVTVRAHTHWGGGAAARAQLYSPQAPPSVPRRPRVYIQRLHSGGPLTAIFRWEPPAQANGIIRGYEAQCWTLPAAGRSLALPAKPSACADAQLSPTHTQLMLRDLVNGSTYFFQVHANTDAGFGQYSEIVSASPDGVNPIPKVLISSQESIKIIDLDSGESEIIPKSTGIPLDFTVSIEENIVYWVNNLEEVFSSRINGSGHYKLASITDTATSICVDWVGRSVYWAQMEMTSSETYVVYRADLGIPNTRPHISRMFARRQPIYSLQISPLQRSLFWYEESTHPGLGTLMTAKVNGSQLRTFFNNTGEDSDSREDCTCPENPQVARPFVIDMTSNDNELYWVDPWVHHIVAADMDGCKCRVIFDATPKKKYGFTPKSITVDSKFVYWFNSTEKVIFFTNKNKKSKVEQFKTSYGYKIMALDPGNQQYPPKDCLYPDRTQNIHPKVTSTSANSISLRLPKLDKPSKCKHLEYEMAATEYTIYYRLQQKDSLTCDKESCPSITTTSTEVILNELKPFTNYTVMLEATNYYAKLHEVKPIVGSSMVLHTASEAPTAPRNVTYSVLSPVLARVEWTPDPGLWYELHWRTDDSPSLSHKLKEHNTFEVSEGRSANMIGLSPSTVYTVWVRARSNYSEVSADSEPFKLRTYPPPAPLALKNTTAYEMHVLWPPPTSYTTHKYQVEYTEIGLSTVVWKFCTHSGHGVWRASNLRPKTRYRFRLRLQYVVNGPAYYWPHDDKFTYETLGDVPGPPGSLRVEAVGDRVLRAWWSEPDTRGAPIEEYRVWGRPQHRISYVYENVTKNMSEMLQSDLPADLDKETLTHIIREGLHLLHNGTETYWLIGAGEVSEGYVARVQAKNSYGWGALSAAAELDAAPLAYAARPHPAALAVAVAALAALVLTVAAAVFYTYNNRTKKKAAMENQMMTNVPRRGPDVELATLRQLPIRHSTNILYNQGVHCPSDAELASLPHIRREQITLTKFLGSGAFGEVFEGIARQINGSTVDTKVAVKTLRKGATEQEKTEFLKEAALMSNFKHEHILRLLGVCLDNDPNYIIMELMEGGDLLSYLRAKRASLYTPESLTLLDLLNMCVDVTRGCRYLEEMHFVHRDLACRNCLVAHRANGRVVKIGDFGLARDIYKNDYYRKEGEGLLPVRWMAVECLVDGVFSCQSDVWAWGVLCWEVLSLGQQPYPARTNRQVLGYVRAGGTPDRPPNCPSVFYELLQKCWSYSPDGRPSFRHCLEVVTTLRDKTSPNITLTATPTPAPHYLTLLGDDEDFPEQQMEPSHLLPQRTPKYLELMYDSDSGAGTVYDGYEIPRAPVTYLPFSRHSIVGVAPNRLIKPPIYRTHSLRTHTRPPNATIIPLRNGIVKRASLCETIQDTFPRDSPRPSSSRERSIDHDIDKHVFKTPF